MTPVETLLAEIERELKKGVRRDISKLERLNRRLDQLLGTEMPAEDPDQAEAWERSRR